MNTTYEEKTDLSEEESIRASVPEKWLEFIRKATMMENVFMGMVLSDKECVKAVLDIILKINLTVIESNIEYEIKSVNGRSVTLDVFAVDSEGKRYNIEIQRDDRGAKPKRARLHCAYMDSSALKKGQFSEDLPECYVIFITENDVLKGGLPIYNIEQVVTQTNSLFNSGLHIVYVNSQIKDNTPLGKLMSDFHCSDPSGANYGFIKQKHEYYKNKQEGVNKMSSLIQSYIDSQMEEYKKEYSLMWIKQGIEQGKAEMKKESSTETAKRLLKMSNFNDNIISEISQLPVEEVCSLRKNANIQS